MTMKLKMSSHILLENVGKADILCYHCNIIYDSKQRFTIYGCVQCRRGFHIDCFSMYHFQSALNEHKPVLQKLIKDADGEGGKQRRNRKVNISTRSKMHHYHAYNKNKD